MRKVSNVVGDWVNWFLSFLMKLLLSRKISLPGKPGNLKFIQ